MMQVFLLLGSLLSACNKYNELKAAECFTEWTTYIIGERLLILYYLTNGLVLLEQTLFYS